MLRFCSHCLVIVLTYLLHSSVFVWLNIDLYLVYLLHKSNINYKSVYWKIGYDLDAWKYSNMKHLQLPEICKTIHFRLYIVYQIVHLRLWKMCLFIVVKCNGFYCVRCIVFSIHVHTYDVIYYKICHVVIWYYMEPDVTAWVRQGLLNSRHVTCVELTYAHFNLHKYINIYLATW